MKGFRNNLCALLIVCTGTALILSCDSSSSSEDPYLPFSPTEIPLTAGTAINYAKNTFASIPAAAFNRSASVGRGASESIPDGSVGEISSRDSNCGTHGEPYEDGTEISSGSAGYAAGLAYCKTKYNDLSPETIQGAMTISGGISCIAYTLGLFDGLSAGGSNSITTPVVISTTCFGSQAEVNEIVAEMGTSILPSVQLTVTDLSTDSSSSDYRLDIVESGETINVYIKQTETLLAAKTTEGSDSWAFKLDTASGLLLYEYLDNTWTRRMRLLVQGSFASDNTVDSITALEGAYLQGGESNWYALTTFESDGSSVKEYGYSGTSGASYQTDVDGNCEGSDCTGITGITASQSDAEAFLAGIPAAATAQDAADALLNFTTVDISVNDTYSGS